MSAARGTIYLIYLIDMIYLLPYYVNRPWRVATDFSRGGAAQMTRMLGCEVLPKTNSLYTAMPERSRMNP